MFDRQRPKCEFNKSSVKFLGHIVDQNGIRANPAKTNSITKMPPTQLVTEVMGLVNQLGKFSSRIAEISQRVRELLRSDHAWVWDPDQQKAFEVIKQELIKPTVLALYNPEAETKVSVNTSSYGLGVVLLQQNDGNWKPVAYASRSLSDTERRYAQIEQEALASTWACEKFRYYTLGRSFLIESDHKPLIPLLNTKHLDDLPPRILRFRLRLAKFKYTAQHIPEKLLYVADALSRAPEGDEGSSTEDDLQEEAEAFVKHITRAPEGDEESSTEDDLQEEAEAFVKHITVPSLPATPDRLAVYHLAQKADTECAKVRENCQSSWAGRDSIHNSLKPYWKVRGSLTLCDGILLYNNRIVVPTALRKETLTLIHEGHQVEANGAIGLWLMSNYYCTS